MVPISTINTENGKVSCETPDGTVINININQRSVLDCLLDTIKTLQTKTKSSKSPTETKPTRATANGLTLGLGISLISLGCICVMLAIIFSVIHPSLSLFYSGTHYWVGFLFILFGSLSVVSYRYPKPCWEVIAFIGVLGTLAVSIAGMVFSITDISMFWYDMSSVCDDLRNGRDTYNGYGYRATRPPRDYYNTDWDLERCKDGLRQYQNLLNGLVIMTLLMMIWGLCISLISLGCRLKSLCCDRTCEKSVEDKDDPLLSASPTGDVLVV